MLEKFLSSKQTITHSPASPQTRDSQAVCD